MIFSFFSGPIFVYLVVSFPLSVSSFYSSWLLPPALSLLFLCFSWSLSHRLCISYLIYCCRCRSRHRCRRLCGLIVVCSSSYVSSDSSHFLLCFTVVVVFSVLSGFLSFSLFFSFVALLARSSVAISLPYPFVSRHNGRLPCSLLCLPLSRRRHRRLCQPPPRRICRVSVLCTYAGLPRPAHRLCLGGRLLEW